MLLQCTLLPPYRPAADSHAARGPIFTLLIVYQCPRAGRGIYHQHQPSHAIRSLLTFFKMVARHNRSRSEMSFAELSIYDKLDLECGEDYVEEAEPTKASRRQLAIIYILFLAEA